ncbi:hypothetical protein F2Q65_14260 [Thiohalocapsa marina]|uniref:Uncharacterized protein n=1 Tax=Thiohalocapsa marina TaxID=424902 RepID=A0A5M8FJS0_9GAMM|nr:hypothetical protein [Thiohalocapsa marina]KAA6183966.1 hypothetical protein F2Q65_14260 [Thiohalocapsa marina]
MTDPGIETLLDLDGAILDQGGGFWVKIVAGQVLPFDHRHRHVSDQGVPYEFSNAAQLLTDFFADVDRVLQEMKRK